MDAEPILGRMAEGAEVAASGRMAEGVDVAASREQEASCGIELEVRYDNGTVIEKSRTIHRF